jgi:diguanylate cyclase (GGDEF)-like protein
VTVSRPPGPASDTLALVARLLALAAHPGEDALAGALAKEARALFGVPAGAFVSLPEHGAGARVAAAGGPVRAVPAATLGRPRRSRHATTTTRACAETSARSWPARWASASRRPRCCSCACRAPRPLAGAGRERPGRATRRRDARARREIERAERTPGAALALVLFDLDRFKEVNDEHGHLVGDEVLRRVGHALQSTTRPYDLAARHGGDEFALIAIDASEEQAREIADRAIERISVALADLAKPGGARATAGVAAWAAGLSARDLIDHADRALLYGKRANRRGAVLTLAELPPKLLPGRAERSARGLPPAPRQAPEWRPARGGRRGGAAPQAHAAARAGQPARRPAGGDDRRRRDPHRRRRGAARGVRLLPLRRRADPRGWLRRVRRGPRRRLRAAPDRELAPAGRARADRPLPRDAAAGARRRRPRRAGLRVHGGDDGRRSELVVPLLVDGQLYGAINVEEVRAGAFDEDDVRLLQTVADQAGAAMRSAALYERLERAYLGTAEALAAALEAKDAYTADHARSIADQAEAVGRRLGLGEQELRDLRLAAVFHDIGKIAVPESILNKPGPLTADGRAAMERHTVVGEQILAPVEFLAGVRRLVRHEHERWDGAGYPDGLAGEEIPLGSRIILACDALHAMTSDRPYRHALPAAVAHDELRRHAGTQFDPAVVEALLAEVFAGAAVTRR